MYFLKIKILIFYLFSFLFLEIISLSGNSLKAEFYKGKNLGQKIEKNQNLIIEISSALKSEFINYLSRDINKFNKLPKLLANNNSDPLSVDIVSDTQYEMNNVFYAEGNVIINFGDFILSADKVSYDRLSKKLIASGSVKFSIGSQYFEASSLSYNVKSGYGYVNKVYGLIDIKNMSEDLDIKVKKDMKVITKIKNAYEINDLNYLHSTTIGLVNEIEDDKKLNVTDVTFDIPEITRWRFKADKFLIEDKILKSDRVIFTNDPYNKPQLFLESNNFSAEIIEDKLKIVSRNSWINLDSKFKFPIGRRTIFDNDPISTWALGSHFVEKDGWYLSRSFVFDNLPKNYQLEVKPYILFQRGIRGNTRAFREKDSSILSKKVKNNITIADLFGLDLDLMGKFYDWDLGLSTRFNSLNLERLSESARAKFVLKNSFIINEEVNQQIPSKDKFKETYLNDQNDINKNTFGNIFDIKFASSFRELISRGYAGDSEIYFGNAISIANRKNWKNDDIKSNLAFIYNLGRFTAESSKISELITLSRNVFATTFDYEFPIVKIKTQDKSIDQGYKYTPVVIREGINWITNMQAGTFLYSDGSNQNAFSISSGPKLTFGKLKRDFLDYSSLNITGNYILKDGDSPFNFDSIDDTLRLEFNFNQQLIGGIFFNMDTYLNLDVDEKNYGKFEKYNFGLSFQRRAYKVSAYYVPSSESVGIQFQIFNFEYSGFSGGF